MTERLVRGVSLTRLEMCLHLLQARYLLWVVVAVGRRDGRSRTD